MKTMALCTMAFLYAGAGILHFIKPDFYLQLMPSWMPFPKVLVGLSGIIEMGLAILLLPVSTRKTSAWLIVCMLGVFFFTIHIPQTLLFYRTGNKLFLFSVIRLFVQFLLAGWAWLYTKPLKGQLETM
jgi:uncharacterized membrane protein